MEKEIKELRRRSGERKMLVGGGGGEGGGPTLANILILDNYEPS